MSLPARAPLRLAIALGAALSLGVAGATAAARADGTGAESGTTPTRPFPFLDVHPLVEVLAYSPAARDPDSAAIVDWHEVGYDRRLSIELPAGSALRLEDVPSGPRALLQTGVALASDTPAGALRATITCRGPRGADRILTRRHATAARWRERRMSLRRCSAPTTRLELRAECRRGDCGNARVVWGAPRVEQPRVGRTHARRLVLLVSVDTLRPDRMSVYGGPAATPALERLARDGVVFEDAVAPSPWTIPSHASLFTSTYPRVHGVTGRRDLPPSLPTLAEVLRDHGWETAGFVDHPWLGEFGFRRGHLHYDATLPPRQVPRWGVAVTAPRLLRWLSSAHFEQAYIFWHVMDVHGPYGATAPFAGRRRARVDPDARPGLSLLSHLGYHDYLQLERFRNLDDLEAAYDESISMVDAAIGRVLDTLRDAGLYDDALVIVTADHGESFFDHGIWVGHGLFLTDDQIRIPLIVKLPEGADRGSRVGALARLVDVAPTVLDVAGLEAPASFEGASLVELAAGEPSAPRVAYGTSSNTGARYVRTDHLTYISPWALPSEAVVEQHLFPKGETPWLVRLRAGAQLYDLDRDPRERHNLVERPGYRSAVARMEDLLGAAPQVAASEGEPALVVDADLLARLRALGYLPPAR